MKLNEIAIDNVKGWGAVPYNQEVDYFGIRVSMRPSVFLKLAASLRSEHNPEVEKHIASGGSIGAPFLQIAIPDSWIKDNFTEPAHVIGHEGRNRMVAVSKVEGDNPIEVHILLAGGLRARHITPEIMKHLNTFVCAEKSDRIILGPYFTLPK